MMKPSTSDSPRKAERNCHILEQRRLGYTLTEIGALHDIHPTHVKKIILAEIKRDQRLQNEAMVLARQAPSPILLSGVLQQAISEILGKQKFSQSHVATYFRDDFGLLLRKPGISSKHLRELRVWLKERNTHS